MITNFGQMIGNRRVLVPLARMLERKTLKNFTILGGVLGTGKSSASKLTAMTLTCEKPVGPNPCLECDICKSNLSTIDKSGSNLYVKSFDMSRIDSVTKMNEFIEQAFSAKGFTHNTANILSEFQTLSSEFQDKILEALDRLHPSVYIIANCTSVHKLKDTIRSRTRPFIFNRLLREEARILTLMEFKKVGYDNPSRSLVDLIVDTANGVPRDIVELIDHMVRSQSNEDELRDFLGVVPVSSFVLLTTLLKSNEAQFYKYVDDLLLTYSVDSLVQAYKEFASNLTFLFRIGESSSFSPNETETLLKLEESDVTKILSNSLRLKEDSGEVDFRLNFISLGTQFYGSAIRTNKERVITQKAQAVSAREAVMQVTEDTGSSSFVSIKDLRRRKIDEGLD